MKYPVMVVAALAVATAVSATRTAPASSRQPASAVSAFGALPASAFPATVTRGRRPETGSLRFQFSFGGKRITVSATAKSVSHGRVGTLTRNRREFILRFTRLRYRVAPIKLPNGLTIASQTISLSPATQNTLRIDRRTGSVTSNMTWIVDAPNALYNGRHTVTLTDKGKRRFLSFKRIGPRGYSFDVRSLWHGFVTLASWSVAGTSLPGGPVTMDGTWNGRYVLTVR